MVDPKKLIQRFAPFLAVPDGATPFFGTRLKQAIETIKQARNGKAVEPHEPSPSR